MFTIRVLRGLVTVRISVRGRGCRVSGLGWGFEFGVTGARRKPGS